VLAYLEALPTPPEPRSIAEDTPQSGAPER
jgi:hypothetical protein